MNARWREASRSSESASCVEVARLPVAVLVRDSKRPEDGYHTVPPAAFGDLLAAIKRGEMDP